VQLTALVHFAHDVAAAHELALDIELRDRRPIREFLDSISDLAVGEHVDRFVFADQLVQNPGDGGGEAAARRKGRSLHEKDNGIAADGALDLLAGGIVHRA
jgi:hypothetical protein